VTSGLALDELFGGSKQNKTFVKRQIGTREWSVSERTFRKTRATQAVGSEV
jgi:hypothetical protein